MFCFSVISPESFENLKRKWKDEVIHHCPSAKRLLVGTKKDLRNDPEVLEELAKQGARPIAEADAEKQKGLICCERYVECSARLREGVDNVFMTAMQLSLQKTKKKKRSLCSIL